MFGAQSPAAVLGTQISSLRIIVTVREGRSSFRVNALIAPPNGATIPVVKTDTATTANQGNNTNSSNSATTATNTPTSSQTTKKLNYPFTILEFRENDEMPSPPQPVSI